MKVVLNQDVKGLGKKFQIIEVSEGYARNFLLPKNIASLADQHALNEARTKSEAINFKKETDIKQANVIKEKIEKTYIEFKHKIGDNGKLFGSVTEKEIAEEVENKFNIKVDKKKISLDSSIKEAGTYVANVKVYEGIVAKLKVLVVGI
jgi:large subunit ribosomal protein L9